MPRIRQYKEEYAKADFIKAIFQMITASMGSGHAFTDENLCGKVKRTLAERSMQIRRSGTDLTFTGHTLSDAIPIPLTASGFAVR